MKNKFLTLSKYLIGLSIILLIIGIIEYHLRTISYKKVSYNQFNIYSSFFKKTNVEGTYYYQSQHPLKPSVEFPVKKEKNTIRIFILGGSVAEGLTTGILESGFKFFDASKNVEVINCGIGGYDSFKANLVFKEILNYQPDLIVILSGNNEFHILDEKPPSLFKYPVILKTYRFLNRLYFYQALKKKFINILDLPKRNIKSNNLDKRKILLNNFENNLRDMVIAAKRKRIPIFLCTLPVNYKYPPCDRGEIYKILTDKNGFLAMANLDMGKYKIALELFSKAIKKCPENPQIHFALGKIYENLGNYKKAQYEYKKSIDLNIYSIKCNSYRNNIIKSICNEGYAQLIDIEHAFIDLAPNGILDFKLFNDFCHWNSYLYNIPAQKIAKVYFYNHLQKETNISIEPVINPVDKNILEKIKKSRDKNFYWDKFVFYVFIEWDGFSLEPLLWIYDNNSNIFENGIELKNRVKKAFKQRPWLKEYVHDIDKKWNSILFAIGNMYKRLGKYEIAIQFYNEAIRTSRMHSHEILPILLFRGLTHFLMGSQSKAYQDFEEVMSINNNFFWLADVIDRGELPQ